MIATRTRRQVLAVHLGWGTYGFWLPNDPRGSGSRRVWAEHLKPFGEATFLPDRKKSRACDSHDWRLRRAAKEALLRPAVILTGLQARCIAYAIGAGLKELGIACWAFAVLRTHLHMVVGPSRIHGDKLQARLKTRATQALVAAGLHPFQGQTDEDGQVPKCFQEQAWPVWKYTPEQVRQAIRYVADNPVKDGEKRQPWKFIEPYPG